MGTNADLVAMARLDGLKRGDVYRHLFGRKPGAFEHFAKERCLLPARAFPQYRDQAVQTPWWRLAERLKRLEPTIIDAVEAEVRKRGPLRARDLSDRGSVLPIDWSGWKGTSKASSMAIDVLWTQCRIVVCGRTDVGKHYDVPERALPDHHDSEAQPFERWALLERVEAAGLLARAGGATWSMLRDARTSGLVDEMIAEGDLEELRVEGSSRPYLAPAGFRERRWRKPDARLRLLAPLDPLLWDRKLVRQIFDFDYVWEVYKPAEKRRWGWYVVPLLHRGRLVGRLSGRVDGTTLVVEALWKEEDIDLAALDASLEAHALACGCDFVKRPKRAKRNPSS